MNSRDIVQSEAAAWVARALDRQASDEERLALDAWRQRSAAHEAAYIQAEQTWRDLASMGTQTQYRALLGAPTWRERLVSALRQSSRNASLGAGVAAAAAVVGIGLWHSPESQVQPHRMEARPLAVHETLLPDGSRVTLGPEARIDVQFVADARRVTLVGGDAFFSVTKDSARPFFVSVGQVQIRVVGTQFEVRERSDAVSVAVAEGTVELSRPEQPAIPIRKLTRGEAGLAMEAGQLVVVQHIDPDAIGAWRNGRLVYDNVELRDVIADANRYTQARIVIADEALDDVRVTTAYPTSQVDQMLDTLERAFPIEVERLKDGGRVLHARR
jgi:transmembrane sensor